MARRHTDVRKRLTDIHRELARERDALRILDEQQRYLADVASDAERRAVVASTPLADRELRQAASDHRRAREQHAEVAARVRELEAEQDLLLERLAAGAAQERTS